MSGTFSQMMRYQEEDDTLEEACTRIMFRIYDELGLPIACSICGETDTWLPMPKFLYYDDFGREVNTVSCFYHDHGPLEFMPSLSEVITHAPGRDVFRAEVTFSNVDPEDQTNDTPLEGENFYFD